MPSLASPRLGNRVGVVALLLGLTASCSDPFSDSGAGSRSTVRLVAVEFGRICDVYAQDPTDPGGAPRLMERDVVVGLDVPPPSDVPVQAASPYAWRPRDPFTGRPRLLIRRAAGSAQADDLLARARRALGSLLPRDDLRTAPPVPFDAALVLRFDAPVPLTLDDLAARDDRGDVTGLVNHAAVQLLRDPEADGARLLPLPARILPRGDRIVVDPTVSTRDANAWQIEAAPLGLPRDDAGFGSTLRVALRLDGPGAWPAGTFDDSSPVGTLDRDPDDRPAWTTSLRIATAQDDDPILERGSLPDRSPPRLLAARSARLARVEPHPDSAARAIVQIDNAGPVALHVAAADQLRLRDPRGNLLGDSMVLQVLAADENTARLEIEALAALADVDPSDDPDLPDDPVARRDHVLANGGRIELLHAWNPAVDPPATVLVTEGGGTAMPGATDSLRALSPFTRFSLRFDQPIDPATVRPLDTFFVATRDVFDEPALVDDLVTALGGDPARAHLPRLITPHLVASRARAVDPATWSIEPVLGLYLDDAMRDLFAADPEAARRYDYVVHVLGGAAGIRDHAGNPLALPDASGEATFRVALDLRRAADGTALQPDNRVVHVVRRFDDPDEDPRPSPFLPDETPGDGNLHGSRSIPDLFGAVWHGHGRVHARATTRSNHFVDDLNQAPLPSTVDRTGPCPSVIAGEALYTDRTARAAFGPGLSTPLNQAGARSQFVYREHDLGLSFTDPHDLDLDVEQIYWVAKASDGNPGADTFGPTRLDLGHSERRPEPCIGQSSNRPEFPQSGLVQTFADNYAADVDPRSGQVAPGPAPHVAFATERLVVDVARGVPAPTGDHRYLPLPEFERPLFTFRDQRLEVQGDRNGRGSDVRNANQIAFDYLRSPYGGGLGETRTDEGVEYLPTWSAFEQFGIRSTSARDDRSGGGLGAIALPLLLDWRVLPIPDDPEQASWPGPGGPECPFYRGPADLAFGRLGAAASVATTCAPSPAFRAYSTGFVGDDQTPRQDLQPQDEAWFTARGGFTPNGAVTLPTDNTVPWIRVDFLARRSVATAGLVDLFDPHRRAGTPLPPDPRLGPFFETDAPRLPPGLRIRPRFVIDGPSPAHTGRIEAEFRATGPVDPEPWRFAQLTDVPAELRPTPTNVALDPRIAGDCWLRKYDDRTDPGSGRARDHWTYPYHQNVTTAVGDLDLLFDQGFLDRFAGPHETFGPRDLRSLHWRLVFENGEVDGFPLAPSLDGVALVYRIEAAR